MSDNPDTKAALEREAVGNAAALREALVQIVALARQDQPRFAIISTAETVLAAPPRNCDRFDSYEQARSEWWKTEVLPRVYGVVSGAEKPFDEWLFDIATEKEGETDGSK